MFSMENLNAESSDTGSIKPIPEINMAANCVLVMDKRSSASETKYKAAKQVPDL